MSEELRNENTAGAADGTAGRPERGLIRAEEKETVKTEPATEQAAEEKTAEASSTETSSAEPYDHTEKVLEAFNNLKSKEFFDPAKIKDPIHVIGCGAVGGAVCELLARLGVEEVHIWDFDTVSPHNLGNQIFRYKDIGHKKVDAISSILHDINPNMEVIKHDCPITTEDRIGGYIFLSLDNIDVRRELCEKWRLNPYIKCVVDGRMRLTDGNIHFADWGEPREQKSMILSMNYTHEEALAETPVSACGLTLSVVCTPRTVSNLMVSSWIKFCNARGEQKKLVMVDAYAPAVEAY